MDENVFDTIAKEYRAKDPLNGIGKLGVVLGFGIPRDPDITPVRSLKTDTGEVRNLNSATSIFERYRKQIGKKIPTVNGWDIYNLTCEINRVLRTDYSPSVFAEPRDPDGNLETTSSGMMDVIWSNTDIETVLKDVSNEMEETIRKFEAKIPVHFGKRDIFRALNKEISNFSKTGGRFC